MTQIVKTRMATMMIMQLGIENQIAATAYRCSTYMELRWARRRIKNTRLGLANQKQLLKPVYISSDPSHINPYELRDLYATCNHSCHRFPDYVDSHGTVEPVDIDKLSIALSHSSIVVSVFCKPYHIGEENEDITTNASASDSNRKSNLMGVSGFWLKMVPVNHLNGRLVGFGRAVTDCGLTASIYDVMVAMLSLLHLSFLQVFPSLRRMGIGEMIVQRIIRMLTSKDIYDIAALCSDNERGFFKACGFGKDTLGSTAMMYTRTATTTEYGSRRAGRKLLLIPPLRETIASSKRATK